MRTDYNRLHLPKVSIVTASYNQGCFIRETLNSLISQGYPNLEYIVMDGKSTDQTIDILREYERHFYYWESKPDEGAADAIEKGRRRCTGELFNWLNSDDYLLPGTLHCLGAIARRYPEFEIYAFRGVESGYTGGLFAGSGQWPNMKFDLLAAKSHFAQEGTFVRSKFLEDNDICVRKEFSHWFDTILYEEMLEKGARVLFVNTFGGVIRHHPAAKTSMGAPREMVDLTKDWEMGTFDRRMRAFRRLGRTRLNSTLKRISRYQTCGRLLSRILDKPAPVFALCRPTTCHLDDPEAWTVEYN